MWSFFKNLLEKKELKNIEKEASDYLDLFKDRRPVPPSQFIVLDTETTGLNTGTDKILSFGGIRINRDRINVGDSLYLYIISDEESENKKQSAIVHGISKNEINQYGIPEKEAAIEIINFISNYTIIAHHASFDIAMLNKLIFNNLGIKIQNKVIDTVELALKKDFGRVHNIDYNPYMYSLDVLLKKYSIRPYDRHNALGDSLLTARLFMKLTS
ncbi:3'-5' exonuclease [Mangrovivirga cuniculi]|uniref:Exonuclease domain-containing protein n=1 Tax=Mangrovivirga cuniculi TaxID=2715131 RepID=A0A4D7JJS5_9BACT|nr:3'-5' exonuclease [Mangrovivirga cuniculi]QCK15851.1 hypothetical protein DCC35_14405 [Mangrovivirga cuniculi]